MTDKLKLNLVERAFDASLLSKRCELEGMIAANAERTSKGMAIAYGEEAFFALQTEIADLIADLERSTKICLQTLVDSV